MKKIMAGVIALMLIAGTSAYASDKKPAKKAKAKAKKECKISDCKDKKDCKVTTDCPIICVPSSCGK
jgi:hypothetical protein